MLNVNPTNSSKIAKSVQRDYQQAAEAHRLTKAGNTQTNSHVIVKVGLTLTTITSTLMFISQVI